MGIKMQYSRSHYRPFEQFGFSGYEGESDCCGVSGFSGCSGYEGESGISGFSGYQGVSGFSGISCCIGESGYSGLSHQHNFNGVQIKSSFTKNEHKPISQLIKEQTTTDWIDERLLEMQNSISKAIKTL